MDLSGYAILDTQSGTFFDAGPAVLINFAALSDEDRETLIEGTDRERIEVAERLGRYIDELIPEQPNQLY